MRSYKVEGFIIRRRNSGEADRILTVFTKGRGKIQIKAKGVRKINSRRSAHVELLNLAILDVYDNSKFPILTEATSIETFTSIKNDLSRIGFAYHICELIDGLCAEHQEHPEVFDLIEKTLKKLDNETSAEEIIRDFEIKLLKNLGFISTDSLLNPQYTIEDILERKLKTRPMLPLLA